MSHLAYSRILWKLSGEALSGNADNGITKQAIDLLAEEIIKVRQLGVELALVSGAGNWLRGAQTDFIDRVYADQMGMYATVMNGFAIASLLMQRQIPATVVSALDMPGCMQWDYKGVLKLLQQGEVIIFVGGTGNPFFSTDSAAALRAVQLKVDLLVKATKFKGIFTKDPAIHSDAEFLPKLSYAEVIDSRFSVMDLTAFDLCQSQNIPIRVCNMSDANVISDIAQGQDIGTLVC